MRKGERDELKMKASPATTGCTTEAYLKGLKRNPGCGNVAELYVVSHFVDMCLLREMNT